MAYASDGATVERASAKAKIALGFPQPTAKFLVEEINPKSDGAELMAQKLTIRTPAAFALE